MALSTVVTISNQRRDSINKTIFLVVICFIISWLPNFILSLYITFGGISGKISYQSILQIMAHKIWSISYAIYHMWHIICDISYVLSGFLKFISDGLGQVQYVKCIIGSIKSYSTSNNGPYDMAHIIWVTTYEIWTIWYEQ